jgi:hypothetical protein
MGWGRMLLMGNVGQQLDIGDIEQSIGAMRQEFLNNQNVDLEQAKSIANLRRENQELKLYVATLVKLLVGKGVLRTEEVETVVKAIEK